MTADQKKLNLLCQLVMQDWEHWVIGRGEGGCAVVLFTGASTDHTQNAVMKPSSSIGWVGRPREMGVNGGLVDVLFSQMMNPNLPTVCYRILKWTLWNYVCSVSNTYYGLFCYQAKLWLWSWNVFFTMGQYKIHIFIYTLDCDDQLQIWDLKNITLAQILLMDCWIEISFLKENLISL